VAPKRIEVRPTRWHDPGDRGTPVGDHHLFSGSGPTEILRQLDLQFSDIHFHVVTLTIQRSHIR